MTDSFRVGAFNVSVVQQLGPPGGSATAVVVAIVGSEMRAALRVVRMFTEAERDEIPSTIDRYELLSKRYAGFVPRYFDKQVWNSHNELPEQLQRFWKPSYASYLGLLLEEGTQGDLEEYLLNTTHHAGDVWWATVALRLLGFLVMAQREVGFEHRDIKFRNIVLKNDLPLLIDYDTVRFKLLGSDTPLRRGTLDKLPPELQRVPSLKTSGEDHITNADILKEPIGAYDNWSLGLVLLDGMLGRRIRDEFYGPLTNDWYDVENMRKLRNYTAQMLKAVHDEPAPDDTTFTEDVRRSMAAFPPGARNLFRLLLARDSRARVLRNDACDVFRTNAWLRSAPGYNDFMYDYGYRIAAPFPNIRWSVSFCIGAPLRCGACGGRDRLHMCATTGLVVCGERCWDAIKT
jgi:serine/threonine protein kinase